MRQNYFGYAVCLLGGFIFGLGLGSSGLLVGLGLFIGLIGLLINLHEDIRFLFYGLLLILLLILLIGCAPTPSSPVQGWEWAYVQPSGTGKKHTCAVYSEIVLRCFPTATQAAALADEVNAALAKQR